MSDEQEIRELVARWLAASKAGDVDAVMSMVTDDVVFLQPGRAPMLRPEFESAQRGRPPGMKIEASSEIQEIVVLGEWAFMWTALQVSVGEMKRSGHTLTVLRKVSGQWRIARDANVMV
jgi:uncharacterized protein (TIGR02246 family)